MEAAELAAATDLTILPMRTRAKYGDILPPAVVKLPTANSSASVTASALIEPFTPEPRADQLAPSHLAILRPPPSETNQPPTYKSVPDTAIADTSGPFSTRLSKP